uniref:Coagulation factor VII n=1 Tax=Eptatretus burgeri TaxID=7764 RepID=A0A8C4WSY1_EPTBU
FPSRGRVTLSRPKALSFLKPKSLGRGLTEYLEEMRPGSLERECHEEHCTVEEAREVLKDLDKTVNTDDCASQPCQNGGQCLDMIREYSCTCTEQWQGRNCEKRKKTCEFDNGGCAQYCMADADGVKVCGCALGYTLHSDGHTCVEHEPVKKKKREQQSTSTHCLFFLSAGTNIATVVPRITGGDICFKGHCPWQVLLLHNRRAYCGGVLISREWVLTAAHCVRDKSKTISVRLGEHNLLAREDTEESIRVSKVLVHSMYNEYTYDNDIALLKLSKVALLSRYIVPICLPEPLYPLPVGSLLVVSGWGSTTARQGSIGLRSANIRLVSFQQCSRRSRFVVTQNMLCAGGGTAGRDACSGDSGGPLTVERKNVWYLVGLVSWGEGCAKAGKYGIYTKVSQYLPWIHTNMAQDGRSGVADDKLLVP